MAIRGKAQTEIDIVGDLDEDKQKRQQKAAIDEECPDLALFEPSCFPFHGLKIKKGGGKGNIIAFRFGKTYF